MNDPLDNKWVIMKTFQPVYLASKYVVVGLLFAF